MKWHEDVVAEWFWSQPQDERPVPAIVVAAKFKLTAPEPSERDLQIAVRDLLNALLAPPAIWFPYPAGVTRLSAEQFAQYSRFGLKRGIPDVLIAWRQMFAIELKTRRGRLSKTKIVHTRRGAPRELIGQEEMHRLLLDSGAFAAIDVARSIDDVCKLLDLWHIPKRGGGSWLRAVNGSLLGAIFARPVLEGDGDAKPR